MENYADLMFRGQVTTLQKADGSHAKYQAVYPRRTQEALSATDRDFIQSRESFYIASVNPDGWPYIQHRGGAPGFLKTIGPARLACLDYAGNRQFITMGHLATDPRVSLFLMDYMNRARMKIQGRASLVPLAEADPGILAQFQTDNLRAERLLVVDIVAMDWNCPQYIPSLIPVDTANAATDQYTAELQQEIAQLKAELEVARRG